MGKEKSFTFLVTGVRSNDYAVKKLIGEDSSQLFYKLPYMPPYQAFSGIREFQVKARFRPFEDSTKQHKYAVVDLSEWIGHEKEEYLEIFMKFLHDYSDYFKFEYIFTVGSAKRSQIKDMLILASTYLEEAHIHEDLTLVDKKKLAYYLKMNFAVNQNCAEKMAEIFVKNQIDGYTQLNMFMNEIYKLKIKGKPIDEMFLLNSPKMKRTKFHLVFEKEIEKWRTELEKTELHKCS